MCRNFRAFAHDGAVYTVINPSPVQAIPGIPVVNPHLNLDGRDLRRPLYATNKCPEIAYMLSRFQTENAFMARLQCDRDTVQVVKAKGTASGYMLSPPIAKSWWHLESSLIRVSDILLDAATNNPEARFPFNPFWPNPSEYRYRDVHPTEAAARVAALKARDACAILAARCTMMIALLTSRPDTDPPRWVVALLKANIPPAWIDEFRASVVADLSPNLRVGAVIYPVVDGHYESATAWVNHVPCMLRANLPVYIAWPSKGLADTLMRYPFLRDYVPDFGNVPTVPLGPAGHIVMHPRPRLVGMQDRFRWSDICPPNEEGDPFEQNEPSVMVPHGQGQRPGESCHEFFARREATNRKREEKESPDHRTKRLQRQQKADTFKRPTRPTHVYLWKEVGEVDDQVPVEMFEKDYRAYVKPGAVAELWESHPNSHKRYDAWADEWDICAKLAPDDMVDDPWDEMEEPNLLEPETSYGESRSTAFYADLQWLYGEETSGGYKPISPALADILVYHYGLVSASAVNAGINWNAYPPEKLRKFIGHLPEHLPDQSIHCRPLSGLIHALLSNPANPSAPGLIWDLNPSCDYYLLSARKHPSMEVASLRLSGHRWYRIRYANDTGCWWELVVRKAATVLELYRQRCLTSHLSAVEYLASRGMAFQTIFRPDRRDAIAPLGPNIPMMMWRPRGVPFGRHDYLGYQRRARELLLQPRGRAAFLRGGIVWRLAVELLHGYGGLPGVVTAGPSKDVYHWGQVFRPARGDDYYDDHLSDDELDAICGVYKVFTNYSFKQTEDLSWWPKPNVWERCSLNADYWTPWCEEWFQVVLTRHLAGDSQLKNSTDWKNSLSQFKPAGKLRDAVELASEQFIQDRMRIPSIST